MTVLTESTDDRGVAELWLNRPDAHNALSAELIDALHGAATRLGADPSVRAVVLAGTGRSFCAGGDLGWMKAQHGADAAVRGAEARRLADMLRALYELPKPLIARIHGNAFGGGVGLTAVADIAVAAEGVRFGLTETRLGLIPATIGPYVAAALGPGPARRIFFTGRLFDAAEAHAMGLVARLTSPGDLDAAVEAEIAPVLSAAPGAVARAKAYLRSLGGEVDEVAITASIHALSETWNDPEASAGITAFFAKKPPPWAG
ncbi:MAG: crotonase/enoyl-CoA hydratase family protein [Pseudomonadota bacterium]